MSLDTKAFTPVELTDEQLAEMREEVHDRVIIARVGLLLRHPFFGNMATRMRVQSCDDWCPTAATDGRNLYYNTQFFNMLSNKQIEFVIAHEILHCVFDHIVRREDRDAQIYNIACDYLVNNVLVRDKIGERVDQIQIFQDFKYDGWASEEVYDDIFEKYDEEDLKQLGQLLDEHVDWEKDGDSANGKAPGAGDKEGEGEGRPTYSKDELKKIRDEIKESMITSAQSAGAGNTPGEISRMIKELTEPKMNWRELLRQQIQSTIKSDFTFSRPSRKGWHTGAILPGMNFQDTIDLCIGVDMSGSIRNTQAADFLGEVKGIMDEYQDYKIKLWCFDTDVYNEEDFSADGGTDITDYEILGGGGTDFDANWTYMKQHDIQPKKFIMFTDGYPFGSWGDEDYCDTIFVIHSHRDKNLQAPFGMTAHYEESI
jgi:predicted metal-dependent peptidase|tara:strand:+ start:1465 stop:2745 length:1281 start_codon:yes stop_codon:yes gene_type:complete